MPADGAVNPGTVVVSPAGGSRFAARGGSPARWDPGLPALIVLGARNLGRAIARHMSGLGWEIAAAAPRAPTMSRLPSPPPGSGSGASTWSSSRSARRPAGGHSAAAESPRPITRRSRLTSTTSCQRSRTSCGSSPRARRAGKRYVRSGHRRLGAPRHGGPCSVGVGGVRDPWSRPGRSRRVARARCCRWVP